MSDISTPFRGGWLRTADIARRVRRVFHDSGVRSREYRPFPNVAGRNGRQELVEIPIMTRVLGLPRQARILEIGCGRGIGLVGLSQQLAPSRLVGIDVDRDLAEHAREHAAASGIRADVVHGDARRLPFRNAAFDVVVDFGTCYHIAFAAKAVDEVRRVLDGGGVFVHETRLAQLLSHPIRSFGHAMPRAAADLAVMRWAGLWCVRRHTNGRQPANHGPPA